MNEFVRNPKDFESIEERNEYFKTLSREQRKVFVSLDILSILKGSQKLKNRDGDEQYGLSVTEGVEDSKELQEKLLNNRSMVKCNGCAQAMAALCSIRVGNQITSIKSHEGRYGIFRYITTGLMRITVELGTFSRSDMKKLEILYETVRWPSYIIAAFGEKNWEDAREVVDYFKIINKGKRLIAIFESVVKNNGKIVNAVDKI